MGKYWKYMVSGFGVLLIVCVLALPLAPQLVSAEGEQEISGSGQETANGGQPVIDSRQEADSSEKPVYHAAMGIQTATEIWIQRWGYFEGSQNEYYNTENYGKLYAAGGVFYDGTFEDTEIKGNGTYTVALKDADFAGETAISQMHIATDIPLEESKNLSFTDVTLEINGNEVLKFDEAVMEDEEPYLQGGAVILLLNHWRDSVKQAVGGMGRSEDSSNGWELLEGSGKENVSIRFTVSGLPYDNEEQAEAEEEQDEASLQNADGDAGQKDSASLSESSKSEESSLGMTQVIGIIAIAVLVIVAIIVIIIINTKKKGSY